MNGKSLESLTYQEVRRWFGELIDRYQIDPNMPLNESLIPLANAISQQVNGRAVGWVSPLEASLSLAIRSPGGEVTLLHPQQSLKELRSGGHDWPDWMQEALSEPSPSPKAAEPQVYAVPRNDIEASEDFLSLHESQKPATREIVHWLKTGELPDGSKSDDAMLRGYAGMGKTYVGSVVLAIAVRFGLFDSREIVVAAPSHQARKVARNNIRKRGLNIDTCTYAGLLGLRPKNDPDTGEEIYAPGEFPPKVSGRSLVVGDEGSQWKDELQQYLDRYREEGTRVLWIGDDAQLPPPGNSRRRDRNSTDQLNLFGESEQSLDSPLFKLPGWELTEVIRYSGDIAWLCDDIRKNLDRARLPLTEIQKYANGDGSVELLSTGQWRDRIIQEFKDYDIEKDPDGMRVLAWRNKRVDSINARIHEIRYGKDSDPYCPGELIIARQPCYLGSGDDRITLLQNGEQALIVSAERACVDGLNVWWLYCTKEPDDNGLEEIMLQVIDISSQEEFDNRLKILASQSKADKLSKHPWLPYYNYKEQFHSVSLAYAITVHKSQGSTYGSTFVDLGDISYNKYEIRNRNRMIYTASTRCSAKAIFVDPRS